MGVNSLPKTVTRQRRGCDLNPGPSAHESSTLTTRLLRPNYIIFLKVVQEKSGKTTNIQRSEKLRLLYGSVQFVFVLRTRFNCNGFAHHRQ